MISPSLSITLPTPIGELKIYANQARLDKATKLIAKTPEILNKAYADAANKYGKKIAVVAKECLAKGMPPRGSGVSWAPHSPNTIRVLGEHSLLYWSSQYYRSIQVLRRGKRIAVGVPPGRRKTRPDHRSSRVTVSQVAKMLEFGSEVTDKLPARPLWRYLWPAVGGKDGYKKELVVQIRKQLRKYR